MPKRSNFSTTIILTDARIEALRIERDRTSIGPQALLKGREDVPEGLNHAVLTHWMAGRVRTLQLVHLEYVLELWRSLPSDESLQVTPDLVFELNQLRKQSRANPVSIVKWRSDVPAGLTTAKINRLLSGKSKTVRKRYVDYLRMVWCMDHQGS